MGGTDSGGHTTLTRRNFAGFASMMLLLEFIIVGMGAVDLLMIAPLGVDHIAALGLGDLIAIAVFAFFTGLVHAYAGRVAIAEGGGELSRRLPVLAAASLVVLLGFQALGVLLAAVMGPALSAIGQAPEIVPAVDAYLDIRLSGIVPALVASVLGVTLRVCGARNRATVVLALGFTANLVLDYLFLYTGLSGLFATPESGVAFATVLAQTLMVPVGAWFLFRVLRDRGDRLPRPGAAAVGAELRSLAPTACGIGGRHVNDYMSATVPILFIGTLGAGAVAATAVAGKLYTLYCRLPQSCFEAAFVFYGYVGESSREVLVRTFRTVTGYSGVVTAASAMIALAATPWLVAAFSGEGVDRALAQSMFLAYMVSMPVYFFDQILARFLAVHQRGNVLFGASTLTYAVALPLAWWSVFVLDSAFWAIASRGAVFALSALAFWWVLRRIWAAGRTPAEEAGADRPPAT
ncbi:MULTISPECIES: MATE family efflux transporter [unclassified Nocardiopsis]|uniref:MATE family efflux transporter n=1 Tax=Nocardiopsis TaxID=2013 RepID=UPI00387B76E2